MSQILNSLKLILVGFNAVKSKPPLFPRVFSTSLLRGSCSGEVSLWTGCTDALLAVVELFGEWKALIRWLRGTVAWRKKNKTDKLVYQITCLNYLNTSPFQTLTFNRGIHNKPHELNFNTSVSWYLCWKEKESSSTHDKLEAHTVWKRKKTKRKRKKTGSWFSNISII